MSCVKSRGCQRYPKTIRYLRLWIWIQQGLIWNCQTGSRGRVLPRQKCDRLTFIVTTRPFRLRSNLMVSMNKRSGRPVLHEFGVDWGDKRSNFHYPASKSETGQTKSWDWSDNFAGFGILSEEKRPQEAEQMRGTSSNNSWHGGGRRCLTFFKEIFSSSWWGEEGGRREAVIFSRAVTGMTRQFPW